MSERWEFHVSEHVARFAAGLPPRQEARLLAVFDELARRPAIDPEDRLLLDKKGRKQWQRFREDFVIVFWIDHAEREIRVSEAGHQ